MPWSPSPDITLGGDTCWLTYPHTICVCVCINICLQQEKYLQIRPEFVPSGGLMRPPSGPLPGGDRTSMSSLASLEDAFSGRDPSNRQLLNRHAPQSPAISDLRKSPDSHQLESDLRPSPIPAGSSTPLPATTSTKATPPSSSSNMTGVGEDYFGLSLTSELSSFGNLMESFGLGSGSSTTALPGVNKATPMSSTAGNSAPAPVNVAPPTRPLATSTGTSNPYLSKYGGKLAGHNYSRYCTVLVGLAEPLVMLIVWGTDWSQFIAGGGGVICVCFEIFF